MPTAPQSPATPDPLDLPAPVGEAVGTEPPAALGLGGEPSVTETAVDDLDATDDDLLLETVYRTGEPGTGLAARLGIEALGAFLVVTAGFGVALFAALGGSGALGTGLAFGLALIAAMAAFGWVSGGHFNPAVTLGAALAGRTPWRDVLPYWLAQVVGGALAGLALYVTALSFPALKSVGVRSFFSTTANGYGKHSAVAAATEQATGFGLLGALVVQIVLTALLVAVFLGVTGRGARHLAPVVTGLTYTVLLLAALPVTGGGLNPAVSTAAAIFSAHWAIGQLWLFWLAPLAGAVLAGGLFRLIAPQEPDLDDELESELVWSAETA